MIFKKTINNQKLKVVILEILEWNEKLFRVTATKKQNHYFQHPQYNHIKFIFFLFFLFGTSYFVYFHFFS